MLKNFLVTSYRTLFRNKAYFLLGTVGLSLGISCVIALYSIINFQSNYDTYHEEPQNIYRVIAHTKSGDQQGTTATVPHPFANGVRDELSTVLAISNLFMLEDQINVPQANGNIKKLKQKNIAFVQPDAFQILNFNWVAGAPVESKEAVYLSTEVATKLFDVKSDYQSVLERTIVLANKYNLVVKGVYEDLPKRTDFPFKVMTAYENQKDVNPYYDDTKWGRLNGGTECILRLNEGADVSNTLATLQNAFNKHIEMEGYELDLQPLHKIHTESVGNYSGIHFEPQYKAISYTLAIFLALIGSINFINLTTARAVKRAREVGIRKVMGSSRLNLMLQFFLETHIIVLISLGLGFFLGEQILILLDSVMNLSIGLSDIALKDWVVFSVVVAIGMTIVSAVYPAFVLSGFSALNAIKIKVSNVDRQSKVPLRKILVGVQFGFSVLLISSALVIFNQTDFMRNHDMGFTSDNIVNLYFPKPDPERQLRLKTMLERNPAFESVSLHLGSPLARTNNTDSWFNPILGEDHKVTVNGKGVDENYLDLFDLELLEGRNITPQDPVENIIVTRLALSKFDLGDPQEALGKEVEAIWGRRSKIIGVVEDFNAVSLHKEMVPVFIYYNPREFYELAVKVDPNIAKDYKKVMGAIETNWEAVYPELLIEYSYFDEEVARRYRFEEVMAQSIGFFVVIALIISVLGLYGLTDYMANSKRKEIGIRKVVGAEIKQILYIFIKEVMLLLVMAFAVASSLSIWLMNNWLEGFEYRIDIGWEIIALAFVVTTIVAFLSMGYRSYAAARINPVNVLKDE